MGLFFVFRVTNECVDCQRCEKINVKKIKKNFFRNYILLNFATDY